MKFSQIALLSLICSEAVQGIKLTANQDPQVNRTNFGPSYIPNKVSEESQKENLKRKQENFKQELKEAVEGSKIEADDRIKASKDKDTNKQSQNDDKKIIQSSDADEKPKSSDSDGDRIEVVVNLKKDEKQKDQKPVARVDEAGDITESKKPKKKCKPKMNDEKEDEKPKKEEKEAPKAKKCKPKKLENPQDVIDQKDYEKKKEEKKKSAEDLFEEHQGRKSTEVVFENNDGKGIPVTSVEPVKKPELKEPENKKCKPKMEKQEEKPKKKCDKKESSSDKIEIPVADGDKPKKAKTTCKVANYEDVPEKDEDGKRDHCKAGETNCYF